MVNGSRGRVDEAAYGCYGFGDSVAPAVDADETVEATVVAPTIAELLELEGDGRSQ